jgi:hypothetical protein
MKGGSLDNKAVYYVVVVVAILNIIAYISVHDWKSVGCFVVAGMGMYAFSQNKTILLIVAILAASICRATYVEGMETKTKISKTPKDKMDDLKEIMSGANLEGLTQNADKLVKRQQDLFNMADKMGPMMKQASDMMKQLPEGFLEKAMKNFNKQHS